MTFDELDLLCAVRKSNLGGKDPLRDEDRMEMARAVAKTYSEIYQTVQFQWSVDDVIEMFTRQRKNENTKVKADIAMAHGTRCFWAGRGKGPCCGDAEAGHLVPNSQGGELSVANCIIECRAHNNQRRAMLVEEYLLTEQTT